MVRITVNNASHEGLQIGHRKDWLTGHPESEHTDKPKAKKNMGRGGASNLSAVEDLIPFRYENSWEFLDCYCIDTISWPNALKYSQTICMQVSHWGPENLKPPFLTVLAQVNASYWKNCTGNKGREEMLNLRMAGGNVLTSP